HTVDFYLLLANVRLADNGWEFAFQRSGCGHGGHTGIPATVSTLAFGSGPVISRHMRVSGITFCGFSSDSGLDTLRRRTMISRSSSVNMQGIRLIFSLPTPCSPVIEPPRPRQKLMISL